MSSLYVVGYLSLLACVRGYFYGESRLRISEMGKKGLKEHNGELKGGAKASRSGRPWICACLIRGFKGRSEANPIRDQLQFYGFVHSPGACTHLKDGSVDAVNTIPKTESRSDKNRFNSRDMSKLLVKIEARLDMIMHYKESVIDVSVFFKVCILVVRSIEPYSSQCCWQIPSTVGYVFKGLNTCAFESKWKQISRKLPRKRKSTTEEQEPEDNGSLALLQHRHAALDRVQSLIDCSDLNIDWQRAVEVNWCVDQRDLSMSLMKGEPLVRKIALIAKYAVFPGAMAAAVIYSPPTYASYYKPQSSSSK
ncbi:hypothetical protein H5410_012800 [Solanum commersonii]|nr:hypothetical protein H5410_012800 [Solanum commersonii]